MTLSAKYLLTLLILNVVLLSAEAGKSGTAKEQKKKGTVGGTSTGTRKGKSVEAIDAPRNPDQEPPVAEPPAAPAPAVPALPPPAEEVAEPAPPAEEVVEPVAPAEEVVEPAPPVVAAVATAEAGTPGEPPPAAESLPPAEQPPQPAAGPTPTSGPIQGGNGTPEDREDDTPIPDPFANNRKWSLMIKRVGSMQADLRTQTKNISGVVAATPKGDLITFAKAFAPNFKPLNDFFKPVHDQLMDGAAYMVVNPAIGLNDMEKLNEQARNFGTLAKRLDKSKVQWIEINALVVTVHYIFDRLYPQIEKWGLEESDDSVTTAYPSWIRTISADTSGEKATYELHNLDELISMIDAGILEQGAANHMFRDLEKLLRKYLGSWDPESDYNIYCYGNNEYGVIHDLWDILTDAAVYFTVADMKWAVLKSLNLAYKQWMIATGGGEEGTQNGPPAEDIGSGIDAAFDSAANNIIKKINIADPIPITDDIVPGPTTFKCDKAPGDTSEPDAPGSADMPPGHEAPATTTSPALQFPADFKPTYPVSEWGIPPNQVPPKPLSPKAVGPNPYLDPQAGPAHPLPNGYIDKRPGAFQFASFHQAYMGYLEAEMVLNPDGSCKSTCADFKRPFPTCENKTIDCPAYRNSFCEPGTNCMAKSNCPSTARKCIRTNFNVEFCPSQKTDRIYDWVDINGTLVGKVTQDGSRDCAAGAVKIRERWEMDFGIILNAPQYCEVCLCVCDTPMSPEGQHYVDMSPMVASPGNVITALKFVQVDNILRLQAEESKLDENGKITGDPKWIEGEAAGDKGNKERYSLLAGPEGFRKMGLDMVYGKKNQVITGVKLVQKGDTVHLSAQVTAVDENTGALQEGAAAEWVESNYPEPDPTRRKISMDNKISSAGQLGPSQPFNVPDNKRYIRFDASSLPQDAGQAVIPFFDIQPVRHHTVRKPLNAIGFLYKSKKGYGGFISPVISSWRKF